MPIVSTICGLRLNHDTNPDFLELSGLKEWTSDKDKRAKELQITFGGNLQESHTKLDYNKYVFDGSYNKAKKYWETDPVFRVPTEDLSLYNQLRLMEWFKDHNKGMARYEASAQDVRKNRSGEHAGLHLPMWIMDYIIGSGILEQTLHIVKLPGIPYVDESEKAGTPEMIEEILDLYSSRKENSEDTYEEYSKQKDFKELLTRFNKFNLKANEKKALELATKDK